MSYKKISVFLFLMLLTSLLYGITITAVSVDDYIDTNIPDSWYNAPKTASEIGIEEYYQSPMLDDVVESGDLPPVEQRLPDDPPVIEPYKKIGEYGGTINLYADNLAFCCGSLMSFTFISAGQATPDGKDLLPYLVKGWEYSEDGKKLTIKLRKGMKWSDGEEFTADDYIYWWQHVANNEVLNSISPENWQPVGFENVTKVDKWTVKFHFTKSYPRYHEFNFPANLGEDVQNAPSHFMKKFHPDFVNTDELERKTENAGLNHWSEYYNRIADYWSGSPIHPEYENQRPMIRPWIPVERTETTLILERNPYWPFVDSEGNQLPYIDRIRLNLINDIEMEKIKITTGDADFSGHNRFTAADMPLFKGNEEEGDYTTYLYYRPHGAYGFQLNLTHPDPDIREIYQDIRFRKALSLGLDREDISEKCFYGYSSVMQGTVPPISEIYKEEYGNAYVEYDPERARELLDEMGLKDIDNDGWRERSDGENFNIRYIYHNPSETKAGELAIQKWKEIGLNIDMKKVSSGLLNQRRSSNNFDIGSWGYMSTDLTFGQPFETGKIFAPVGGNDSQSPWPGWANWVSTDGEEGIEPPEEIKKLVDYANKVATADSKEEKIVYGNKLAQAQAENLWFIGYHGMTPQPVLVNNKLKTNVPKKGLWDWNTRYLKLGYPMQFYIEGAEPIKDHHQPNW